MSFFVQEALILACPSKDAAVDMLRSLGTELPQCWQEFYEYTCLQPAEYVDGKINQVLLKHCVLLAWTVANVRRLHRYKPEANSSARRDYTALHHLST